MVITNPFGRLYEDLIMPDHTQVVGMKEPLRISNPAQSILDSLEHPIESESLQRIARRKLDLCTSEGRNAKAVIVVSDNTRPVPYRGEEGILLPIIEVLRQVGYHLENILVLIATGTHRAMSEQEIQKMIDPKVIAMGVQIENHDCKDQKNLTYLGKTQSGTEMHINSRYVDADLKIATGLVESHFMAGASGGRKAICPGLIGEYSTFVFHGAPFMAHENSRDLNLEGNLVHEEAVEVAQTVGVDFLVNVTLDHEFHITGIFSGDLIAAHLAAVKHIRQIVGVEAKPADIVVTHAGFVGINHYQCAKCAVASLGILKENGYLIIIADTTDEGNVVGGINYRTTLSLLKLIGHENFLKLITSDDWTFIPEQWQVQMWAKVYNRIPQDHMILYAPQLDTVVWEGLPGTNGAKYLKNRSVSDSKDSFKDVISNALSDISLREKKSLDNFDIAYISDGPYVVPTTK